jgi:serine/threonine protein kinase
LYSLNALSSHGFALWSYFVEIDDIEGFESVLAGYCEQYAELIYAHDRRGRRVVDIAAHANKKAIQSFFLWFGKYRITEFRPEHQSSTCFVYKAVDEFDLDENGHPRGVALKLMKIKSQFLREIHARESNFDPKYIINVLEIHPSLSGLDSYPDDLTEALGEVTAGILSKQQAEKLFCVIMPLANRNLFVAMKQERFAGVDQEQVRHTFTQLCRCVQHMHERGVIHADIKPLNVMRLEGSWRLIDLDAACRIGIDPVGSKSSSAFIPPEAVYTNSRLGIIGVRSERFRDMLAEELDESVDLVTASPAFDIWSLGCILFQLCHKQVLPLFQGGCDDNLSTRENDSPNLWSLAGYSDALLRKKLDDIFDPSAANLISQMLAKDAVRRPTIERVLIHPFLSQKPVARLLGEKPQFDIFISYRVASDARHTEYLYNRLTAKGFKVWWDKVCLAPGVPWEEGFCQGLVNSRSFVCIVSKGAINHPDKPWNNFGALTQSSSCDNVLLEHRLALELRLLGYIEKIYPVMIGEAETDSVTPSLAYSNFFAAGGKPQAPDLFVDSVERKLEEHMEMQALGKPVEKNKTVKAVLEEILACQGKLIQGDGNEAFNEAIEAIRTMLIEAPQAHHSNEDDVVSVDVIVESFKQRNSALLAEVRDLKQQTEKQKQQTEGLKEDKVNLKKQVEDWKQQAAKLNNDSISLADENAALKRQMSMMRADNCSSACTIN